MAQPMLPGGSGRERGSRLLVGDGGPSIPAARKAYASAQINERRARILSEALALIVETGSTGFYGAGAQPARRGCAAYALLCIWR